MRNIKLVLTSLLLFVFVSPSHGMTTAQILAQVRTNLRDQSTTNTRQQFSDATLIAYENDGQREANVLAWLLQDQVTITLVSGTREYNLPTGFLATDRVIFNNTKLTQTSLSELDATATGWLASTGATPQKYYIYRTTATVIGFSPKPLNPTTTSVLIYYLKQPNEITSTSDIPWNGWDSLTPYHSALVYYITARCFKALEEPTSSDSYYAEWSASIEIMRHSLNTSPDYNPGLTGQRK